MRKIFIAVLMLLSLAPAFGQDNAQDTTISRNNPYKIDDRLYPIYRRADRARGSDLCLKVCDTLREESIRLGDGKAECLSYVLPVFYWSRQRNLDSLSVAAERSREVSRRNGFLQYYYQAYSQECVALMNLLKVDEARKIVNKMYEDARKDEYPFGLYNCYIQNAHLYNFQGSYKKAVSEYVKAAEYMKDYIPDQSPANAYLQAAVASIWDGNFDSALDYTKKGLEFYSESKTNINLWSNQCVALFVLGRDAEFAQAYDNYKKAVEEYGNNVWNGTDPAVAANYALHGQYDEALASLEDYKDGFLRRVLLKIIYAKKGDWRNAFMMSDSLNSSVHRYYEKTIEMDTAEMSALLDTERLEADKARLELENKLSKRRMTLYLIGCVFIVAAGFAIFSILRKRKHINQLRRANEAKDLFVKNMSHEVRTPLNAVVGFSQLLAEPEYLSDEEREEFSKAVADNGNLLAMMIDDILTTNDMIEGNYNIEITEVNLKNTCRSAVKTSQTRLQDGVTMAFECIFSDDVTVQTDGLRVQQVLINLLNNACKNTSEGRIVLSCSRNAGKIIFAVSDTGCGIPQDKAEKIFERFYKIDPFKQGSGLGLALSREIAAKLGGSIRLDTNYSPGARFIFEIPA